MATRHADAETVEYLAAQGAEIECGYCGLDSPVEDGSEIDVEEATVSSRAGLYAVQIRFEMDCPHCGEPVRSSYYDDNLG